MSTSFTHVQSAPSATWSISHGLECHPVVDIVVFINGHMEKILPSTMTYVNSNAIAITFTSPFQGEARLIGPDQQASGVFTQVTPSTTWTADYTGMFEGRAVKIQAVDGDGAELIPTVVDLSVVGTATATFDSAVSGVLTVYGPPIANVPVSKDVNGNVTGAGSIDFGTGYVFEAAGSHPYVGHVAASAFSSQGVTGIIDPDNTSAAFAGPVPYSASSTSSANEPVILQTDDLESTHIYTTNGILEGIEFVGAGTGRAGQVVPIQVGQTRSFSYPGPFDGGATFTSFFYFPMRPSTELWITAQSFAGDSAYSFTVVTGTTPTAGERYQCTSTGALDEPFVISITRLTDLV